MNSVIQNNRAAFTLIEIMLVVAIIAMLATLALPVFVKARKQSQGRRLVNDVRQMDAAIDQWAVETMQADGNPVDTAGAAFYMRSPWNNVDLLGNSYSIGNVGTGQVSISTLSKSALSGVGIDWGAY